MYSAATSHRLPGAAAPTNSEIPNRWIRRACATSLHAAWTAQALPRGRTMGASSTSLPFPSLIYPSADSAVAAEEPSALPLGAQLLRSREALAAELALAL